MAVVQALDSKAAFTPGQHVNVTVNKIVASLLPVCCWIQRDTRCRGTGNMLPGNMLPWCKRGLTVGVDVYDTQSL